MRGLVAVGLLLLLPALWIAASETCLALAARQLHGGGCQAWRVLGPTQLIRPYYDPQGALQRPARALLAAARIEAPPPPFIRVSQEVGGNMPYDAISVRTAWRQDGGWMVQAVSAPFTWDPIVIDQPTGFKLGEPQINPPEVLPAAQALRLDAILAQPCLFAEARYIGGMELKGRKAMWWRGHSLIKNYDMPNTRRVIEVSGDSNRRDFYQDEPVGLAGVLGEIVIRFGGETAWAPLG